jgi:Zn-dependent M28 family amino/carboxypeptidase
LVLVAWADASSQQPGIDAPTLVRDLRRLSADDMEGRRVGTAGGARARALLVERFLDVGLRPFDGSFERPFGGGGGVAGVNVVGHVAGRTRPDRFIVVSAHYDHVGIRDGRIFNGANDNASGAAALPALAAYFVEHRPATSLVFVGFDAEETGLAGSRAFVASPPVPRDAILINLNLDMIGRDPANTLFVVGVRRQPWLRPLIERAATGASVNLRMGYDDPAAGPSGDWTRDSDHWSFLEAGIPALYFGVEDFALLHHPDDDFESMTLDFYVRAVESMVAVITLFDTDDTLAARARGTTDR